MEMEIGDEPHRRGRSKGAGGTRDKNNKRVTQDVYKPMAGRGRFKVCGPPPEGQGEIYLYSTFPTTAPSA